MIAAAIRRVGWSLVVVWLVITGAFFINSVVPGDPARAIAGLQARPADVARVRASLLLERSVATQYVRFMRRLVHRGVGKPGGAGHESCAAAGPVHIDLGMSYQRRRPVVALVADRIPASLALAASALSIQVTIGVLAGLLAALARGSLVDRGLTLGALALASTPTFVTGVVLQYALAFQLRLLPLDGVGRGPSDALAHLVLPALTLGLYGAGYYARLARDELVVQSTRDYVRTARAKGAPGWRIILFHSLRNALLPLVTAAGLDFGALVGGAVVTERVFRWPGLGALAVDAIVERDTPVVLGALIVASVAVVAASLLVDLSVVLLDPRARVV